MAPLYRHGIFSSLIGAKEKHRNLPRSGTPTGAPLYLRHLSTELGQERDDSKSFCLAHQNTLGEFKFLNPFRQ